jgi:hypothetical protein
MTWMPAYIAVPNLLSMISMVTAGPFGPNRGEDGGWRTAFFLKPKWECCGPQGGR